MEGPTDAEFYQLIFSALLQVLEIIASLWPSVVKLQLDRVARSITWGAAFGEASLTVAAVPLYIHVSQRCSGLLLFFGSVSQALV